jgi:tetratricopeptide (TPR) repeat protein
MQPDAAFSTGVFLGRLIVFVTPLIFMILAAVALGQPRANKKCLLSLIILLGGMVVATAPQMIFVDSAFRAVATEIASGIFLVSIVTSAVLAIIGLAEYKRMGSRKGRASAIVALSLTGLILIGILCAVGAGMAARRNGVRPLVAASQNSGQPFVSGSLNFVFVVPSPWVRLDTASLSPSSALSLTRANPTMFSAFIVERPGVESVISTQSMVDLVKAHMQSAATSVSNWRQISMPLHQMDGVLLTFDAQVPGQSFSYAQWIGAYHGFVYQLMAWTSQDNRAALIDDAMPLFQNLQLIDPNLEAHSAGYGPAADFHSLTNGFGVKLAGTNWSKPIQGLFQIAPNAEFGVEDPNSDFFVVIPLALSGHDPDLEMLTSAFLSCYNTQYPGDAILEQRKIDHGPLEGYALRFTRTNASGELQNRAEVLKGNGFAYLLIASTKNTDEAADARMMEVLKRAQFDAAPQPPDLKLLTTREKQARAALFNAIGQAYYRDKRFEQAFEYFKESRGQDAGNAIYALNATDSYIATGQYRAALDDLRGWLGASEPSNKMRARLAFLQSQTGAVDDALKTYASIFDAGYRDDDYFTLYINLLAQSKQHDAAISETNKYLEQNDSLPIRMLLANVYVRTGQSQKAVDTLLEQQEKYPENSQLGISLAEVFITAGRYAEAVEQCAKLCDNGRGTSTSYFLKGRAEYGLKHFREAKASLESALELEPANAQIKAFLDQVSGLLGEGSNAALESVIDPVAIPASLLESSTGSGIEETGSFGGYYEIYSKAIEYQPGKEFKTTERRVIKVLDESGVTAFSSFEVPFDPLSEEIYVNDLNVKDSGGAVLTTGTVSDYYVMDDASSGQASQNKVVHIPVSGLRPGCEISLTFTRRDLGSVDAFDFSTHTFSKPFPVLHSTLFVRAPASAFKAETFGNVTQRKVGDGVCWSIDQPQVYRWEPLQPDLTTFLPSVWLSDAAANWKSVGKDYLDSIRDRLAPDDDIRKAAAEKTASLKSPEDKIDALAQFVQKDFTYTAIEFGRRARIPNKASTTLQNRYGDCKDHAVLLRALLEATGIHAQLALVNAKGDLRKDMPSLDQFDHVIVYVPSLRGGTFIDCTDKDSNVGNIVPVGLAKKDVLLLDDAEPRLVAIPDYAPASNSVVSTSSINIVNDSDASVHENVKLQGFSAAFFRGILRHADPASRQSMLQEQMSASAPALEVQELSFDNLDEPRQPLIIRVAYLVKGKFRRVGDQLIGQLPAVWERMFLGTEAVENRVTPFLVTFPLMVQSSVALALPPDYKADPIPAADIRQEFATCTATAQQEPDALKIDCSIQERTGHFAPSQYASYHDTLSRTLGAIEPNVVLTAVPK